MVLRTDTYGTRGASGVMDGLVEFRTEDGVRVVVEGVEDEDGARLRVFRDGSLRPDAVELEFGVKLSAEAGAVIAKGSAEGHLVVRLNWSPEPSPTRTEPQPSATRPEPRPSPAGPEAPDAVALS